MESLEQNVGIPNPEVTRCDQDIWKALYNNYHTYGKVVKWTCGPFIVLESLLFIWITLYAVKHLCKPYSSIFTRA